MHPKRRKTDTKNST